MYDAYQHFLVLSALAAPCALPVRRWWLWPAWLALLFNNKTAEVRSTGISWLVGTSTHDPCGCSAGVPAFDAFGVSAVYEL